MLFNSPEFLLFLPAVFAGYWMLNGRLRLQNLLVVAASYLFYGWWDWRFLGLIAFTSAWSYAAGLFELSRFARPRGSKALLAASCAVNLGILGCFKYYDFFAAQSGDLLAALGFNVSMPFLHVALPVGISFYTFQALSYTIDAYRRQVRPVRDPIAFFAFISFFPQLVAGPIERASNLLPQFVAPRRFDYPSAVAGCRQMLWGFFKKCVVADNCAAAAEALLDGTALQGNGLAVWTGSFFFAIQIYGDFSGYSDIAIGLSRLFGIRLMRNFAFPYFSRDIAEFWRRWHISLTTWFRDYLYIPLGGSRCGKWKRVRNTFAIFLVSGLWHGANWTFIAWGAYHALLFLPLLLRNGNRRNLSTVAADRALPTLAETAQILRTFILAVAGWTIFRAHTAGVAARELAAMANPFSFAPFGDLPRETAVACAGAAIMIFCEWISRRGEHGLSRLPRPRAARWSIYLLLLWAVVFYTPGNQTFIYFQF